MPHLNVSYESQETQFKLMWFSKIANQKHWVIDILQSIMTQTRFVGIRYVNKGNITREFLVAFPIVVCICREY